MRKQRGLRTSLGRIANCQLSIRVETAMHKPRGRRTSLGTTSDQSTALMKIESTRREKHFNGNAPISCAFAETAIGNLQSAIGN